MALPLPNPTQLIIITTVRRKAVRNLSPHPVQRPARPPRRPARRDGGRHRQDLLPPVPVGVPSPAHPVPLPPRRRHLVGHRRRRRGGLRHDLPPPLPHDVQKPRPRPAGLQEQVRPPGVRLSSPPFGPAADCSRTLLDDGAPGQRRAEPARVRWVGRRGGPDPNSEEQGLGRRLRRSSRRCSCRRTFLAPGRGGTSGRTGRWQAERKGGQRQWNL